MRYQRSRGFTLVELLVVIAIIGILVALLLPAIQAAREAARRTQCTNNLKQLGLAVQTYHDSYKIFPMGALRYSGVTCGANYQLGISWIARVLPGLEQQPLYDQIDWEVAKGWGTANVNATVVAPTKLPAVRCPSDPAPPPSTAYGPTNYVGCSGSDGSSYPGTVANYGLFRETYNGDAACGSGSTISSMAKVTDGTSTTMAISECLLNKPYNYNAQTAGDIVACNAATIATPPTASTDIRGLSWMRAQWSASWAYSAIYPPNDQLHDRYECYNGSGANNYGARSQHPGGVSVCFVDGSTRFVSSNIDLTIWRWLSTIGGQEAIPAF
jgi:prepilin-type N-terminal cleavage/methylation domain-containing protein/prepilin-type processing-associated H-X9-DG protein